MGDGELRSRLVVRNFARNRFAFGLIVGRRIVGRRIAGAVKAALHLLVLNIARIWQITTASEGECYREKQHCSHGLK
jgi:hypothetical protein